MKREKTLRQNLIVFLILALMIPILCFVVISQIRIWKVVNENMKEGIVNDVKGMNTTLDLILDKYTAVLHDFSTDEDVMKLLEVLPWSKKVPNSASSQLSRKLVRICKRQEGVERIELITDSGQLYAYDRIEASFEIGSYRGQMEVPELPDGVMYRLEEEVVHTAEGDIYLYQIIMRLMDNRNVDRQLGTVILSVNTETLNDVFSAGENSDAFICEGGRVLATTNPSYVWQDISAVNKENKMTRSQVNGTSGWIVYDYHSKDVYTKAFWGQTVSWVGVTVLMAIVLIWYIWYVTNPMMNMVEGLVYGMNQVEEGDFSVRIAGTGRVPREIRRIVDGFNQMVRQLEKLIAQVKQSATDQKNAEISAMEAQIDPHFLYNTLDTINWLAIEKEDYEISSMVGGLADILRYSIRNPGETVSVGQALYWLEQYTVLQSKKLDAPLEVEMDVPEEIKICRMHKLLMQPFVENAIRHGFWQKKEICRLKISIHETDDQLHIIVKDNGRGIAPELMAKLNDESVNLSGHVGVNNVRTRLKLYYGNDAKVYYESREGSYTMVHLFVKTIRCEEDYKHENRDCGG